MTVLRTASITTAALGLALGMASPATQAASVAANGAGNCTGTLPAYQTQLRARPLALANEGTSAAFVSCAFDMGYNNEGGADIVVFLVNKTAADIDVTCTGIDGIDPTLANAVNSGLVPAYVTTTTTVPANGFNYVVFDASDFEKSSLTPFNSASCLLPPGISIAIAGKDYTDTAPPPPTSVRPAR